MHERRTLLERGALARGARRLLLVSGFGAARLAAAARFAAPRSVALLLLLPLLLAAASPAVAQVTVQVTEIRASQGEPYMDPRLEPIRAQVAAHGYPRNEVVQQIPKSGGYGEELSFSLGGGVRVTVKVQRAERSSGFDLELDCAVWRRSERVAQARVQLRDGGTHVIGLPASGRERTLVAVTARRR